MTITFFVRLFFPHIGGVEKHVLKISETLISRGHSVTVITEQYDNSLPEMEIHQKINIYRIPTYNKPEKQKKFTIWKWIAKNQFLFNQSDVIHVHDVVFWLYFWKIFHFKKPIFTTFHGWEGIFPIPLKNKLQKKFDAFISKKNICIGDFISKWYGINADVISYGAVDDKKISATKKKYDILYLGRLDRDTGIIDCIRKWQKLKSKSPISLAVAGDGQLKGLLTPDINYLGNINNPEKEVAASKYIYATGYLSILESFYQKKPVITSYDNDLKKDYLMLHPMSEYFILDLNLKEKLNIKAYNWAKQQTWTKLALQYEYIWTKSR